MGGVRVGSGLDVLARVVMLLEFVPPVRVRVRVKVSRWGGARVGGGDLLFVYLFFSAHSLP